MRSDLKPWEHPNIATWVRYDTARVLVACVDVSPQDKSVTASVIVSGQRVLRSFATAESAKAWCDENLEADVEAPEPEPESPHEESPVERLIRMLHNDPDLAWLIANRAKVLGPWTEAQLGWWQRSNAFAFNVALVRGPPVSHDTSLAIFTPTNGDETDFKAGFDRDFEAARQACDEQLRTQGWLLATRPLETT